MPCFSTPVTKGNQFLVSVLIIDANRVSQNQRIEIRESDKTFCALVDTGASGSCIAEEIAKELNLKPTCKKTIHTAGHPVDCNEYDVHILIPVTEIIPHQTATLKEKVNFTPIQTHIKVWKSTVVGLPSQEKERGYSCLLGMDVLRGCTFQYSEEKLTICF